MIGIGVMLICIGTILTTAGLGCIITFIRPNRVLGYKLQKSIKKKNKIKYYRLINIIEKNDNKALLINDKIIIVSREMAESMRIKFDEEIKVL